MCIILESPNEVIGFVSCKVRTSTDNKNIEYRFKYILSHKESVKSHHFVEKISVC